MALLALLRKIFIDHRDIWDAVSNGLKVVGIVVAPLVFFAEYRNKVQLEQKQKSLEEIKAFRESSTFKAIEDYSASTLDEQLNSEQRIAARQALVTGNLCEYHNFLAKRYDANKIKLSVHAAVSRMENLATCANSQVCRDHELCAALAKPIHLYVSDMCTVIERIEMQWNSTITAETRKWLSRCKPSALGTTFCDAVAAKHKKKIDDLMKDCRAQ